MKLSTTKLLPETKRLAKQQAAARGMFLYEYLDEVVNRDVVQVARIGENDTVYLLDLNTGLMRTKTGTP